jgi:hypothetical protein
LEQANAPDAGQLKSEQFIPSNERMAMPSFDIFQNEADGSVLWRGTAASLEEAKARVQELTESTPGRYIILSRQTGSKLIVGSGEDTAP